MTPVDIDYDIYYGKHCARYYGWLPASRQEKRSLGRTPKYFTLCGKKAVDIFMLEKEGVLERDEKGRLPHVIVVEERDEDWAAIIAILRPPVKEAVLHGSLQELILYEDDDEILQLLEQGDSARPSKDQREKLILRERAARLRGEFPFDIINFDPYGNLLNPAQADNRLYHSFRKIFQLQTKTDRFLLFVTTPIWQVHPAVEACFRQDFTANVSSHPEIRLALESSQQSAAYEEIEEYKRIAVCFAKSVVIPAAEGWAHSHQGVFVYENPGRRKMLSAVIEFWRTDTGPDDSVYIADIVRVIQNMPRYYSWADSAGDVQVVGHLEQVKRYREAVRTEYELQ